MDIRNELTKYCAQPAKWEVNGGFPALRRVGHFASTAAYMQPLAAALRNPKGELGIDALGIKPQQVFDTSILFDAARKILIGMLFGSSEMRLIETSTNRPVMTSELAKDGRTWLASGNPYIPDSRLVNELMPDNAAVDYLPWRVIAEKIREPESQEQFQHMRPNADILVLGKSLKPFLVISDVAPMKPPLAISCEIVPNDEEYAETPQTFLNSAAFLMQHAFWRTANIMTNWTGERIGSPYYLVPFLDAVQASFVDIVLKQPSRSAILRI